MTPAQISAQLAARAETTARYLLPGGKRNGQEFVAGSLAGEAGDSLKVCVSGDKTGLWSDFATGQTGGDFLDLWCATRNVDLRQAMEEAASWIGVALDSPHSRPQKTYRRPDRPKETRRLNPDGPVMAYLKSRGLTATTLKAFKVAEQPGGVRFQKLSNNPGTIIFPYFRDGQLLNCKYLAVERSPEGKKHTMQEGGAEPCLFGWQALPANARAVVICEGEIDAMTWYQQGIPALSVPMGGGGGAKQDWIESDYDHLQRFDTILVSMDMDEPGRAGAAEIVRRLGEDRCRMVALPHKDANACLQAGFTQADFTRCIVSAKSLDPAELKSAQEYLGAVLHEFFPAPDAPKELETPWAKVGDRLHFRSSEVTIWAGYSGHGKSLVLNQIAAHGLASGERFCIASMEMPPARTLWRMVRQLTGMDRPSADYVQHCMHWLADKLWLFDLVGTAKIDRMLEVFFYAARRYQIRHFVVDSLAKCGLAEDDYNGQKAIVERLVDFAHQHGVHVHLVSHARKGANEDAPPGKMDVKGTGAITDMVDNVITVWRNKAKEAKRNAADAEGIAIDPATEDKPDAALILSKQRHTGWEGEIWLWFEPASMQYLGNKTARKSCYVPFGIQNEHTH